MNTLPFFCFFKVATVVHADISTGKQKEAGVKNRGSSDPRGIPQTSPPRSPAGATNSNSYTGQVRDISKGRWILSSS